LSDSLPSASPPSSEPLAPKTGPSNLQQRVVYGVLGAALLLGSVWFSPWTFGLFFAFVQAVMLWEFYRMMKAGGYAPAVVIGIGVSILLFAGTFGFVYSATSHPIVSVESFLSVLFNVAMLRALWIGLTLLVPVLLLLREMVLWPRTKTPFGNAGATLMGLLYISVPMVLLNYVAQGGDGYDYRRIFALLFLIWAADIGAYFTGKAFGRHKLAPSISPGKTWEGWAGGALLTLAVGWALGYLLPELPLAHRLVAAGVVAVFGPLGDLAESMLKRSVGVKDSGTIMPGHGGLLDRFDAFLLVLPVLVLLQLLAG
jgi:phosphatidate cytidylyltransferase